MRAFAPAHALLAGLLVQACHRGPVQPSLAPSDSAIARPSVLLHPGLGVSPIRVHVEVARTPASWQRGLMFRERLEDGTGMLFLGERPEHHVFWMKNTLIPLDMIFITTEMTVLGTVENATPMTEVPREVPGPSIHVLEVPGGWCLRNRIGPGARVELQNVF